MGCHRASGGGFEVLEWTYTYIIRRNTKCKDRWVGFLIYNDVAGNVEI